MRVNKGQEILTYTQLRPIIWVAYTRRAITTLALTFALMLCFSYYGRNNPLNIKRENG